MTLQQALDRIDQGKPNSVERDTKIEWLSEIEGLVHQEILMRHWHTPEEAVIPHYDADTDPGTKMLVPDIYASLYIYWVMSKIDLENMENDKYNNDRTLFNSAYDTFSDYWTRTHMPIQRTRELRI